MQKAKKVIMLTTVLAMGATSVTGCQKAANTKAASMEGQSTETKSDVKEITLMASQNWIKDVDRELFKKFKEESGIDVKVLLTPDNGYETLLGTTLSGGSDAVDIFMHQAGSEIQSKGLVDVSLDLSGEPWVANEEDWAKEANTVDGKQYGFSTWGIDYQGIMYNKTFFKENNLKVPATWKDFMSLCDQIKKLGKTPLYEGINGVWHTESWIYGLTSAMYKEKPDCIKWLNESKDHKFADLKSFKEGLNQVKDLLSAKDNGKPKYYTNDGQSEDWFGSYDSLKSRETIMMNTYTAYSAELAEKGAKDEFGMFPIPVLDNQVAMANGGGVSKFINKNSTKIEACKKFLDFLAKSENLETYYAARTDLVSAAFKDVKSCKPTDATTEYLSISKEKPITYFTKDVLYWDPNVYKYFQGFAAGNMTVDKFIQNVDDQRTTMFEAAQ